MIANDLALIGHPLNEYKLVDHVLRGLTSKFKEISAGICARSDPISFEELHEKLSNHEMYVKLKENHKGNNEFTSQYVSHENFSGRGRMRNNSGINKNNPGFNRRNSNSNQSKPFFNGSNNSQSRSQPSGENRCNNQQWHFTIANNNTTNNSVVCQLCDKIGHTTKQCLSNNVASSPQVHYTASESNNNWILDLGASHHITSDLKNLAIHFDYEGNDGIIIRDGSSIPIAQIGSSTISSCKSNFHLNNILCAPTIKGNLISVSQFCKTNYTSIEFYPNDFVVNIFNTGPLLFKGWSNGSLYELP